MLTDNGGNWDAPPVGARWSVWHPHRCDEIIASDRSAPQWGLKDRRMLQTQAGMLEALPQLRQVSVFCNPVAESLHA